MHSSNPPLAAATVTLHTKQEENGIPGCIVIADGTVGAFLEPLQNHEGRRHALALHSALTQRAALYKCGGQKIISEPPTLRQMGSDFRAPSSCSTRCGQEQRSEAESSRKHRVLSALGFCWSPQMVGSEFGPLSSESMFAVYPSSAADHKQLFMGTIYPTGNGYCQPNSGCYHKAFWVHVDGFAGPRQPLKF